MATRTPTVSPARAAVRERRWRMPWLNAGIGLVALLAGAVEAWAYAAVVTAYIMNPALVVFAGEADELKARLAAAGARHADTFDLIAGLNHR